MNIPTKIDKKNENPKYPKIQTMTNGRQLRTNIKSLNFSATIFEKYGARSNSKSFLKF